MYRGIIRAWEFRRKMYIMEKVGSGQYKLNGYHCTDSTIWDYAHDDECKECKSSRLSAERFLKNKKYV